VFWVMMHSRKLPHQKMNPRNLQSVLLA